MAGSGTPAELRLFEAADAETPGTPSHPQHTEPLFGSGLALALRHRLFRGRRARRTGTFMAAGRGPCRAAPRWRAAPSQAAPTRLAPVPTTASSRVRHGRKFAACAAACLRLVDRQGQPCGPDRRRRSGQSDPPPCVPVCRAPGRFWYGRRPSPSRAEPSRRKRSRSNHVARVRPDDDPGPASGDPVDDPPAPDRRRTRAAYARIYSTGAGGRLKVDPWSPA